jgi:uncharacterized protein (DUF1697 family)
MPITLNGDTGVTYPVTAGGTSAVQASSAKVLQVVSTQSQSAEISTSSSSYVTTGISASITPTSSTSKILILLSCTLDNQASGRQMVITFYRGATDLASTRGTSQLYSDGGRVQASGSCMYLDSPATTSSTTYTVYFRSTTGGNTVKFANDNTMTSFTLMEIAA